ncbi:hypothetical protein L873DRAFT_1849636 [Choiromyces venosus 120613-1]|uniref:Uncharacterized protein n=1 Tax=Choiromyces venosus 120613-1 TaxID=1336337 RepID=A0A3N4ITJ3_9PEZI|nr:hypothetical protein L873DRAFT_1849636 [Choiromyces venosus 120613-1]
MFHFTTQRFQRQMFACLQRRGFAHSQMRSTNKLLSAADSSGAKFTFPADNTVGGRFHKLETDYKVSTGTLTKQMSNISTNLTKLEVRIDNWMWWFFAFFVIGGGTFALKGLCFDVQMRNEVLGTVNMLVTASEKSMRSEVTAAKCEMKLEIVQQIRASEDRILYKLDQLKGMK